MTQINSTAQGQSTINIEKGTQGQIAHQGAVAHTQRLNRHMYHPMQKVWCLVGNGLSNQTFVEGPSGIIAIDTGDSIEEMQTALTELRRHTQSPIVACIYTHSHYVNGTAAILQDRALKTQRDNLRIVGHSSIAQNRVRFANETAPRTKRGIIQQFGLYLPASGPDSLLHCGVGQFYRNTQHSPHTPGYIPADINIDSPQQLQLAGLPVEVIPAPADTSDSITIWFPSLGLCVNNLIWPSLFNIYAIRGELYRDPTILVSGIDRIIALQPEQLICTHGAPFPSSNEVALDNTPSRAQQLIKSAHQRGLVKRLATEYRDSLQYLRDQTIRGANAGLNLEQIVRQVLANLAEPKSYHTEQHYGLAEHHIRQIYSGLFGWFDDDPSKLFAPEPLDASKRLIKGLGGIANVRQQIIELLQIPVPENLSDTPAKPGILAMANETQELGQVKIPDSDLRWAAQMCGWLLNVQYDLIDGSEENEDQHLMAHILRQFAQQTTAANIRNWCLTRALELEGKIDLAHLRTHRFSAKTILQQPAANSVHGLCVLLDPARCRDINIQVTWHFVHGEHAALAIRNQVAAPVPIMAQSAPGSEIDIDQAPHQITLSQETWAQILSHQIKFSQAVEEGIVSLAGDMQEIVRFFDCFDHAFLNS